MAEGCCGQRGPVARVRVGIEGAKRPFGCERSEPSCSGLGSAKRSAAERGPNSSSAIKMPLVLVEHMFRGHIGGQLFIL